MSTKLVNSEIGSPLPQSSRIRSRTDASTGNQLERLMSTHAKTFSFAARFLPPEKRADTLVFYAFCRELDDLVDEPFPGKTEVGVRRELDEWRSWLTSDRSAPGPREPLAQELALVIERHAIAVFLLLDLLDGLESDLKPVEIQDEKELLDYCYRVASTVGLGMAHILGATSDVALRAAADLGAAMQLTNILRDVGTDLSISRVYLPKNQLVIHGLDRDSLHDLWIAGRGPDERLHSLMKAEISRARALYQRGAAGIWLLPPDVRLPILIAARLYRRILTVIERNRYDTLRRRASTSRFEKLEEAAVAFAVDRLWRRGEQGALASPSASLASLKEI